MGRQIKAAMLFPLLIWIVFILNIILWNVDLRLWGIHPRSSFGLIGIITSPFLHANWAHIIANTIPLMVLLPLLYIFYGKIKYPVMIFSILVGGFAVWLVGKSGTVHIGASGLIFSLMGFLIAAGIIRIRWKTLIISVIVLFLYGGVMLQGFIPEQGISWEGHLFGALAGIFLAWVFRKRLK